MGKVASAQLHHGNVQGDVYILFIYIYMYFFFLCPDVSLEMSFRITEITGCGKTTRQKKDPR